MNILGLSAFYHESSCCLLRDGRLLAAASEERFTRVKHDPRLSIQAFRHCLRAGGLSITDLDAVAFYEMPRRKLSRQLWAGRRRGAADDLGWLDAERPHRAIREQLGFEGEILDFPHHLSHAASAFYFSGFDEAATLTVDGVGEWATMTYGSASDGGLEIFEEVDFPHSLGLLYSTLTSYLGFAVNDGEYKVMGLAPYGKPRFVDEICQLVAVGEGGQVRLNLRYFDFVDGPAMFKPALAELFGQPARSPESPLTSFHQDVARSLQLVLEEILLEKSVYLHDRTGLEHLCMAGGVALNCVFNGRLRREGPFVDIFVQPAAGDAGGCLGAACLAHAELTGERPAKKLQRHAAFGPSYEVDQIARLVEATGLDAHDFRGHPENLLAAAAARLAEGAIVGWFHGPMEFGPRALGSRSIVADPRGAEVRDRVNRRIKKREDFRPFAPSVLLEHASAHFDLREASPFMLETCQVTSDLSLPAITHVDGSARPQTVDPEMCPRYAALLTAFFAITGCPILLNTSFNVAGEPIVCTPIDALFTLGSAGLDLLVLEDFLIEGSALPSNWQDLFACWDRTASDPFASGRDEVSRSLYTFV